MCGSTIHQNIHGLNTALFVSRDYFALSAASFHQNVAFCSAALWPTAGLNVNVVFVFNYLIIYILFRRMYFVLCVVHKYLCCIFFNIYFAFVLINFRF